MHVIWFWFRYFYMLEIIIITTFYRTLFSVNIMIFWYEIFIYSLISIAHTFTATYYIIYWGYLSNHSLNIPAIHILNSRVLQEYTRQLRCSPSEDHHDVSGTPIALFGLLIGPFLRLLGVSVLKVRSNSSNPIYLSDPSKIVGSNIEFFYFQMEFLSLTCLILQILTSRTMPKEHFSIWSLLVEPLQEIARRFAGYLFHSKGEATFFFIILFMTNYWMNAQCNY